MTAHPATTRADAVAFLAEGASYADAAERFGVPVNTLKNWRKQAALPARRPGPPRTTVRVERPVEDLAFTGRWVRDGLIWRQEGAA